MLQKGDYSCTHCRPKTIKLGGRLGRLVESITENWLIGLRESNPAILDMLKDTEAKPYRELLPWSGEFAGKYLTGATQILRLTGEERLFQELKTFVAELLTLQKENGYFGPFSTDYQLAATSPPMRYAFTEQSEKTTESWDCWGHYHLMTGLLLWYDTTGEEQAFEAVLRIAELFLKRFYRETQLHIVALGSEEMNLSVLHSFASLYRRTGDERYLRFATQLTEDLAVPPAGDYLNLALKGTAFYQMPKPRWESLHPVQGLLEMYAATGNESYRQAAENIWWSITETDVHNTGGFSTSEKATGSPYRNGSIETCCVVAYMALTTDILSLTGTSIAADMLELATFNSAMGAFSPSGRWSTYDTPMKGYKCANFHTIGFQCRPGSPELNCCSVNAPRMFGLLDSWGFMLQTDAVAINYYGAGSLSLCGDTLVLRQETEYPYDGRIQLLIDKAPTKELTLLLRIPFWSLSTVLRLNGKNLYAKQGTYASIRKVFHAGERIELQLDMSFQVWAGEEELLGQGSLYYGPLLLCADAFYDPTIQIEDLPCLQADSLQLQSISPAPRGGCLFHLTHHDGEITLCDLFTAGNSGSPYTTWLPMKGIEPKPFSHSNPFRRSPIKPATSSESPILRK